MSEVSKRLATDETLGRIAGATEAIALAMSEDAQGEIKHWKSLRNLLRLGLISKVLNAGDQIRVEKESGLSTTFVSEGITVVAVNEETFIAAVGTADPGAYEFIYDGAAWHLNGAVVELATYGITITGTPAADDVIVVHVAANEILFDVLGPDYDVSVNPTYPHTLSLLTQDVQQYGTIPFSSPQALYHVDASVWPSGIPANTTLNITLLHGANNNGTAEDGSYQFTTPVAIPVGGKIRHTTMGQYMSSADGYNQAHITGGTFTVYDENYTQLASGIACTAGSGGTNLGTATACDPQYKTGDFVNFTQRNAYGSNRYAHSANRKWLNSAAPGAASGAIASWWTPSDVFDMPVRSTLPGFLHGMDPAFVDCIGKVFKRTALCIADGYGYEDTEEYVWLPSMTELNFGKNNNVTETTVDEDGNVVQNGPYPLYEDAGNADRVKTYQGTARYWWHRSPLPSHAYNERSCVPAGSLDFSLASISLGVVAGLTLI